MRTTITFDEKLFEAASAAAGTTERSVVVREALQALIERDAARRLARLGGSDGKATAPPRRRSTPARSRRRAPA
jgi:Arc/MetJ family transcription regulator